MLDGFRGGGVSQKALSRNISHKSSLDGVENHGDAGECIQKTTRRRWSRTCLGEVASKGTMQAIASIQALTLRKVVRSE
jgi:hypothetical protein